MANGSHSWQAKSGSVLMPVSSCCSPIANPAPTRWVKSVRTFIASPFASARDSCSRQSCVSRRLCCGRPSMRDTTSQNANTQCETTSRNLGAGLSKTQSFNVGVYPDTPHVPLSGTAGCKYADKTRLPLIHRSRGLVNVANQRFFATQLTLPMRGSVKMSIGARIRREVNKACQTEQTPSQAMT